MRALLLLCLVLASSCARTPVSSPMETAPQAVIPFDPEIKRGQLDNGLSYFVKHNQEPKGWGEFWLFVKVGALQEDDDQRGLAHLLEHMAFNGTENFPGQELIAAIEASGAKFGPHLNAHTNWHETIYKVHLPTDDPKHLDKAMLILKDWASGMLLEDAEIDKERGVVIDEWRRRQGAGERLSKQTREIMFGQRYTNRWTIGTEEGLKTFQHDAVRRFYKDWYRPEIMAVAAVGDFEISEMEQRIQDVFSPLTNPPNARPIVQYEPDPLTKTHVVIQTDPELTGSSVGMSSHVKWSWSDTESAYRDRLIESLFYVMANQRLRVVAQQPDPPFVGAGVRRSTISAHTSFEGLAFKPKPGKIQDGLTSVLTEIERWRRFGFTQPELDRAKANMLRSIDASVAEKAKTSSKRHVQELKRHFINGETVPGIEREHAMTHRFLPTITLAEFTDLAEGWLNRPGRILVVRQAAKDAGETLTEESLLAIIDAAKNQELTPYTESELPDKLMPSAPTAGTISKEETHADIGVTEWILSNGMQVLIKPTAFKEDEVRFKLSSWGGHSLAHEDHYPSAASTIAAFGQSGLSDFNPTQLGRLLAGKKATARPYISETSQGITGNFSPKDAETSFQLIHLMFTAPRFDTDRVDTYLKQRKADLENRDASPNNRFTDRKREVIYAGHPRRVTWTPSVYDQVDLNTASTFYKERFANPGAMTALFVGNIDLEALRPLVETYLAGLPGSSSEEKWKDVNAPRISGVHKETVRAGQEDKAQVELTFHGPFTKNGDTDYIRGRMTEALKKKLRLSLREENSGTYGVSVSSSSSWVPKEQYTLSIRFTCESARVDELTEILFEELRDMVATPITNDEVEKLKNGSRKSRAKSLQSNSFWLTGLSWRARYDVPLDDILVYESRVDALTAQSIQEMAKQLINFDQYTHFVLVPESE